MAFVPTEELGKPKMGLLGRLSRNPASAQLILQGLGLLGAKRQSQVDRYMSGISEGLLGMAQRRHEQPLIDAQIANYQSQAAERDRPPGAFSGTGITAQSMNALATLKAKMDRGEPLTQQEQYALQLARAQLSRPQTIQTADGRTIQTPPMDLSFMGMGGAVATPVGAGDSGINLIDEKDPLKESDAQLVVGAIENAQKYRDMLPMFDAIEEDMAIFPTGQFSNIKLGATKLAAEFGLTEESYLAAGERLEKNINKGVSANMEFLKGAMSEGEREFTRQFSIGMNTSVAGNKAYIGFLRAVAKRASKKGTMMRQYFRKNGNSLDGWDEHWDKYINDNPIDIPRISTDDPGIPEGAPPRPAGAAPGQTLWIDNDGNPVLDADGNFIFY